MDPAAAARVARRSAGAVNTRRVAIREPRATSPASGPASARRRAGAIRTKVLASSAVVPMIMGWPECAAATHGSAAGTPTSGSTPATGAKAGAEFSPPGPAWRMIVRFWARSRVPTSDGARVGTGPGDLGERVVDEPGHPRRRALGAQAETELAALQDRRGRTATGDAARS